MFILAAGLSSALKRTFLLSAAAFLLGGAIQARQAADDWFLLRESLRSQWKVEKSSSNRLAVMPLKPSEDEPFQILVLFAKTSSAYDTAMNQVLMAFADKRIHAAFRLVRFDEVGWVGRNALAPARRGQYDLVLAMGSPSTALVQASFKGAATPVVTVCSKDPVLLGQVDGYKGGSGTNIAYTSLDIPVSVQLSYLKQLRPELKRIAVVYANQNISAVKTQVDPLVQAGKDDPELEILKVGFDREGGRLALDRIMQRFAGRISAEDPTAQQSLFWITGSTSVFQEMDIVLERAGPIPVLAVTPSLVTGDERSVLLSIGTSFENNAQLAALYAIRILKGEAQAGSLDVGVVQPPDISINFRKARQLGLKIPFNFFESASTIIDSQGRLVRHKGRKVAGGGG